nr:hypothetical protein [Tanacetum cinerariifolium]
PLILKEKCKWDATWPSIGRPIGFESFARWERGQGHMGMLG